MCREAQPWVQLSGLEQVDVRVWECGSPNVPPALLEQTREHFEDVGPTVTVEAAPRYIDWIKEWARSSEVDRNSEVCVDG
jgi:hypothetical protein